MAGRPRLAPGPLRFDIGRALTPAELDALTRKAEQRATDDLVEYVPL